MCVRLCACACVCALVRMYVCVPVLAIDAGAVQQGEEDVLTRTHAAQHQTNAVQLRQQEEEEETEEGASGETEELCGGDQGTRENLKRIS